MPARKPIKKSAVKLPIRTLYGPPIYDAIKRGDQLEMRKLAAQARKHIRDVTTALTALEKKISLTKK